jgi:hypothetical protein
VLFYYCDQDKNSGATRLKLSGRWAGKRRSQNLKTTRSSASTETAASSIVMLVEQKRDYYAQMLAMRREEHEQRMRVLRLKEQYYAKLKSDGTDREQ